MATFIKLPDGKILNASSISEVLQSSKQYSLREDQQIDIERRPKRFKPALKVIMVTGQEHEFAFDNDEARDNELERLEAYLFPDEGSYIQLGEATVRVREIAMLRFVTESGYPSKRLEVKLKGMKPFRVSIAKDKAVEIQEFIETRLDLINSEA